MISLDTVGVLPDVGLSVGSLVVGSFVGMKVGTGVTIEMSGRQISRTTHSSSPKNSVLQHSSSLL